MVSERLQGEEEFHSKTTLANTSFPCQNAFRKCTTKTGLSNGKGYVKTLYTRLLLQIPLHAPPQSRQVMQPHFR